MRQHPLRGAASALLLISACADDSAAPRRPMLPVIDAVAVTANPHNVLSAVVSVQVRDADSVAVYVQLDDEVPWVRTPAVGVTGETATIPVLGLLPERRYTLRAFAYGLDGPVISGPLDLQTAALPSDLPRYSAVGQDASPGYVVFAAGMYGIVIDNTGRIVWYRRFPNGPWLNFMAQPNGRYVARQVTAEPTDVESWVELDALGNVTRTFGCHLGLQPRFHDLISELDGGYWTLCDESRMMDLTAYGGVANARVTGQAVQHVSGLGELLFHWSPFDHFLITDIDPSDRTGATVNWTHGNSLDLDGDGNLLVSFRNLNEITKIDTHSGTVLWRMGGRRNQFTFSDADNSFAGQHSVRVSGAGRLMLLDNVGDPLESRSEHWVIDSENLVARLIHSYGSVPRVRTLLGGSVQVLGDRTLVSFGTEGRVEEYDGQGNVKWRIEGTPGYVFRAQRIGSLYRPGVGAAR